MRPSQVGSFLPETDIDRARRPRPSAWFGTIEGYRSMEGYLYEFVCDHIIPGCTVKERGDTPEAAREKAIAHLHEHHDMSYIDKPTMERIDFAIRALRP